MRTEPACEAKADRRRGYNWAEECIDWSEPMPRWLAASSRSRPDRAPVRRDHLLGGGEAGQVAAVRRRIVVARARLTGEEQVIVDRRREDGATLGLAGQRVRIGTAGERIGLPSMNVDLVDAAGEIAAEEPHQVRLGEVKERLVIGFEFSCQPSAEIDLD